MAHVVLQFGFLRAALLKKHAVTILIVLPTNAELPLYFKLSLIYLELFIIIELFIKRWVQYFVTKVLKSLYMEVKGVKKYQNMSDVIYMRPLNEKFGFKYLIDDEMTATRQSA